MYPPQTENKCLLCSTAMGGGGEEGILKLPNVLISVIKGAPKFLADNHLTHVLKGWG